MTTTDTQAVRHTPTDAEINRAVALSLGMSVHETPKRGLMILPSGQKSYYRLPDFCQDRNLLPQLWEYLRADKTHLFPRYWNLILSAVHPHRGYDNLEILNASPRLHCIAFLKALEKWAEDWIVEEEEKP